MKTGVIVHGCNLYIENWRHVAWGDPPDQTGRIPHGVLVAHQFDAAMVVFGTGASKKPFQFGGTVNHDKPLAEAEYSLEYLRTYFEELSNFDVLRQQIPELTADEIDSFQDDFLGRVQLDLDALNTIDEIKNAAEMFLTADIGRVIMVSSPSHIVRCLRDAASVFEHEPRFRKFKHNLYASPSVTCYEGSTPADVVVIEPPHRPDRHVVPTHRRIQRMLALQKLPHDDLVELIEEFDDLLQRYEHRCFKS